LRNDLDYILEIAKSETRKLIPGVWQGRSGIGIGPAFIGGARKSGGSGLHKYVNVETSEVGLFTMTSKSAGYFPPA
jgi:hypothetical protein